MTVKERIRKYIKSIGVTITEFEESICVSNGYVNSISKSIGIDKINLILDKYPNIDLVWLLTGKGEMLKSNPDTLNIHNVKKQKPPPVSTPEHEMATIYSMILERSENMARELGRLDAENKQLQTEIGQLKAENEELKKYKLHPLRSDFDSVPSNPLIIVDKPASEEYELETQ